jgi:hypothetical protein
MATDRELNFSMSAWRPLYVFAFRRQTQYSRQQKFFGEMTKLAGGEGRKIFAVTNIAKICHRKAKTQRRLQAEMEK